MERMIEPWSALLDEAREDGRLVREAREGPGEATLVEIPGSCTPTWLPASIVSGSSSSTPIRRRRSTSAWQRTTIVTTGTASGKSLCFNLPTLDALCRDAFARALYLYPTKALAQDQARAINAFGLTKQVRPAIYDGDTPRDARGDIRRRANVVLTNPDMLHVGILPHHGAWERLFSHLRIVVVDEAHVYRGVFGSHVANVLRRLLRVAAAYGSDVRVLLASATIANPLELAERLTGLDDVGLIDARRLPHAAPADRDVEPAADRRGDRCASLGDRRGRRAARTARARGGARNLLHEVAQGRRAVGAHGPRRPASAPTPTWPSGSPPTAPATPPSSVGSWRRV